jgi:hypothetical protein
MDGATGPGSRIELGGGMEWPGVGERMLPQLFRRAPGCQAQRRGGLLLLRRRGCSLWGTGCGHRLGTSPVLWQGRRGLDCGRGCCNRGRRGCCCGQGRLDGWPG